MSGYAHRSVLRYIRHSCKLLAETVGQHETSCNLAVNLKFGWSQHMLVRFAKVFWPRDSLT